MPATAKTLVTKQGKPSKPGTVVDTSKAKVVPASSEVRTEAAAREVATQKKVTQKKVNAAVTKMTKPKSTGNGSGPVARLTMEWTGKDGKDVAVKDRVTTVEGIVIDVIGRWTRKAKSGNVPMVTGHIVSGSKDRKKGERQNAIAAGCTHCK